MLISINGEMIPETNAKISVFDRWFLYWDALFETIPVVKGNIFRLSEHLDRLLDWSSKMCIKLPWKKEDLVKFCEKVVQKNHNYDYEKIKIILSRGISWYGANIEELENCKPNLVIYCVENKLPWEVDIKKWLKLITTHDIRPYPAIKSTSYIASILWNIYAKQKGFDDVLFVNANGDILEGSGFNFFIIKNDTFVTPKENILDGITAQKTIKIIEKLWYKIERRKINLLDIWNISEAFITSTTKKILPVTSINNVLIGNSWIWNKTIEVIKQFSLIYY